ncbi:hypothetical protein BKA69DRAFT_510496 [Paraphysoderma sedebokerense]|nr:hypothetical protein BKA69DRAFT_510321 [Paraphysoderma sedebokerense]KAI9140404.1 hypothetical protein BKA69DRAFT_510496 [Paraphysoderma sedebokerense]
MSGYDQLSDDDSNDIELFSRSTQTSSQVNRNPPTPRNSRKNTFYSMIRKSRLLIFLILLGIVILIVVLTTTNKSSPEPINVPQTLSLTKLKQFISPIPTSRVTSTYLQPILIPRVPSTDNNTKVREFLVSTLKSLNYHVEIDEFNSATPVGPKSFANVIATKYPNAKNKLLLSAHFDSKILPEGFIGATDSAVPCAILLDVAANVNNLLERQFEKNGGKVDTTLQLVFFDGEEAFEKWTRTDSTYGSRHLAEKWEKTLIGPADSKDRKNVLSTIEAFVLLDLLGTTDCGLTECLIHNLQPETTTELYNQLIVIEDRLFNAGYIMSANSTKQTGPNAQASAETEDEFTILERRDTPKPEKKSYFLRRNSIEEYKAAWPGGIEDDHIPFMERGVPILHLIPNPFPRVWHNNEDNGDAIMPEVVINWARIMSVFVAEYLKVHQFV